MEAGRFSRVVTGASRDIASGVSPLALSLYASPICANDTISLSIFTSTIPKHAMLFTFCALPKLLEDSIQKTLAQI
jgi:hypothetical protein